MNTNRNEVSQSTPEQIAEAEKLLKKSTLSLEDAPTNESSKPKDTFETFGAKFDPQLQAHLEAEAKKAAYKKISNDPFDDADRHVPGDAEVELAKKWEKEHGSSLEGVTLQQ